MPYIPPDIVDETKFPLAQGKDLSAMLKLIVEKYTRHYAAQNYYSLLTSTAPVPKVDGSRPLVGATGTTRFDPLYGESVPAPASGEKWAQPHGNAATPASDSEKYDDPVLLPLRVRRDNRENDLKKLGTDRVRTVTATVPSSLLDAAGLTAKPGDCFNWNGERFEILYTEVGEYWKNTNIPLFIDMIATTQRRGA